MRRHFLITARDMYFGIFFFLVFPAITHASSHSCNTINPNSEPVESIAACTELLATNSLETSERAEALASRGIAFRELMKFEESIQDLGASIALTSDTSTMRMLAWTYREVGRYSDAEKLFTRVLNDDTHWQGWLSRCVVRQDMDRFDQALEDCKEALRLDKENLDALYFTARAYSFLGHPEKALPLTKTAMVLAPNEPRHLVEHIWALHQLGRTLDARKQALKGLEQFPVDPGLSSFLNETR